MDEVLLTADGRIDGRVPERVVRTHCAELWFDADRVYKRKRPVDLGFLDFTTAAARRVACEREVRLNRRLAPDVYLGLVDVVDGHGEVVDVAVAMRRLPDDRRLSSLVVQGRDVTGCVHDTARRVAVFHAAEPAAPHGPTHADVDALLRNWRENLAVLADHPGLVAAGAVEDVRREAEAYLRGRGPLIAQRLAAGMVRDGHGDLHTADIFCTDDGPRILDCLEFADAYRIGDVLLDVAFLAMDLERLGRPDLARSAVATWSDLTGAHHPQSLLDHFVAYRAGVRAKVACLTAGGDATGEEPRALVELAHRHLRRARVRLVLVGGLPGTGKTTLARQLSDRLGWALLRSDEVRKDLVGVGHGTPAPDDAYAPDVTAVTYAELLDRAAHLLGLGESVLLDASWADPDHRAHAGTVAAQAFAQLVGLRCALPHAVAHRRLAVRRGDASDATATVHDGMRARFAPWDGATVIDTGPAPAVVADAAERSVFAAEPRR